MLQQFKQATIPEQARKKDVYKSFLILHDHEILSSHTTVNNCQITS